MKLILITLALVLGAGSTAATGDHGQVNINHGIETPGAPGCNGASPSGCYNVNGGAFYSVWSNDDPEHPFVTVCSVSGPGFPNPNPGVWVNVDRFSNDSQTGGGVAAWTCSTVSDEYVGVSTGHGGGTYAMGAGHFLDVNVGQGGAHSQLGVFGGGMSTPGAGLWAHAHSDSRTCAGLNFGTPSGGGNLGDFCL